MPLDPLQQLQLDVTGRLTAHPSFESVQVVCERPRAEEDAASIQTKIDQALAGLIDVNGKAGLCVTVLMPELEVPSPGTAFAAQTELVMMVQVEENVLVNMGADGTRIPAEDAALKVLQSLVAPWTPNGLNSLYADKRAIRPLKGDGGNVLYNVVMRMPLTLSMPTMVALPVMTLNSPLLTITCATEGAAIRYTTDGSFPGVDATLYSASLDVGELPAGTLIRCAAYKADMLGSSVKQLTL